MNECVTEGQGDWGGKATLMDLGNAVVWVGAFEDGMDGSAAQM